MALNRQGRTGGCRFVSRRLASAACLLIALATPAFGGALLSEVWTNCGGGGAITNLTGDPRYPDSPSFTNWLTGGFESPINVDNNYGLRLRGVLRPPQSGNYYFWISGDDHCNLSIGTNERPSITNVVAWVDGWTWPREWHKYTNQMSVAIPLATGRLYYVQALLKEGTGYDSVSIRWELPDGTYQEPVPATCLFLEGRPHIVAQPTNLTVAENGDAVFRVGAGDLFWADFQWQRNGSNLPGATSSNLVLSAVELTNSGVQFRCLVTNAWGSLTTAVATLTVTADATRPWLTNAFNVGSNSVRVSFSEPVEAASATNPVNYVLSGGLSVLGAAFGADARTIVLSSSPMTYGNAYTVTVDNVRDRAAVPNTIWTNSQWVFTAIEFMSEDIGSPAVTGVTVSVANGLDVTAAGLDIGGEADQFHFSYVQRTGDFDVRTRVDALDASDFWAKAGIVARENLNPTSFFAAALATPSLNGASLYFRKPQGTNLLANPDFEDGTNTWNPNPRYWDIWGGSGIFAETNGQVHAGGGRPAPANAHSGVWMAVMQPNGTEQWRGFAQDVPMTPGEMYVLSAYYLVQSNLPDTHTTQIQFEWYNAAKTMEVGPRVECTAITEQESLWRKVTITAEAPPNVVWGRVVINYGDQDWSPNPPEEMYNAYWDSVDLRVRGYGTVGFHPVSYPGTWLRLKREGNLFTAYASHDGSRWTPLGTVSNPMPSTIYLGLAVSSHSEGETAAAEFRDWGDTSGGTTGAYVSASVEPPGPASRRTGLVISEIMYHPPDRPDGKDLEFIELFNAEPVDADLGGYSISGDADFTFPAGTVVPAGGFLVVAKDAAAFQNVYGPSGVIGDLESGLPNGEGTVRLRNRSGAILQSVEYGDDVPWPVSADGVGHSLAIVRPSYGEGDPRAWAASAAYGGSPGAWEPLAEDAYHGVVINEFLAHTDFSTGDFIEIYNASTASVNLSGCWISDDADTNKFLIASLTLGARGFASYMTNQLGFNLEKEGGAIYLRAPDLHVIDAVKFEGQERDVSIGRCPDGAPGFQPLAGSSKGTNNRPVLVRNVVINEIMYHPASEDDADEYVELYNRSASATNIGGWRLAGGVEYTFPTNTVVPARGYIVAAKDAAHLRSKYPALNVTNTFGDYSGKLADGGERIALVMPEEADVLIVVDEVAYGDDERWGRWADGDGSSLELKDPRSDNSLAGNWSSSDETNKAPWVFLCVTGHLDNVIADYSGPRCPIDELHLFMLGDGECLVDEVEVHRAGSSNIRNTNHSFNANAGGWTIDGNHVRSTWETNGYSNGGCLHLRASGSGDTGPNRLETPLDPIFSEGTSAIIQAWCRWQAGHPDVLFRLHGNAMEAVAHMTMPTNAGTPAAANSVYVTNAPPAIWDVSHQPVLPVDDEPVRVTARAHDPDGLVSNALRYRVDPGSSVTTVRMTDDGASADELAGDGLYSAWIPGQAAGTIVGFYVESWGSNAPAVTARYPSDAPAKECLVRFGESPHMGNFGEYRLWMTRTNLDTWITRLNLDNEPLDGTVAYGNFRAIYNSGWHYRGSPFIRPGYSSPTGSVCSYWMEFPESTPLLGADEFNLDSLEPDRDTTRLRERMCFWMAERMGIPFSHQRYVSLYVNGVRRGDVYADCQHVSGDYVESWFGDEGDGEIFKIDDWFEFTNTDLRASRNVSDEAVLTNYFTTGNVKKQARYRYVFEKKSNRGLNDSYTNLFDLVDAANETNSASLYTTRLTALADVEEWLHLFALRHIACDWDGYGFLRGKNAYAYKPRDGRWLVLPWDLDFCLGAGSSGYDDDRLFSTYDPGWWKEKEPVLKRMYDHPPFRRVMADVYRRAALSFLEASEIEPVIDAWSGALNMNGLFAEAPDRLKEWISRRRAWLLTYLEGVYEAFAITSNGGADFDSSANLVTLEGLAPIGVQEIRINGVVVDVTWTSITNWQIRLALAAGSNVLSVVGYDADGNAYTNASDTIAVRYTGSDVSPAGSLVINEVLYNPVDEWPDTEFVEIANRSTNYAFDLYDYRLEGVGLTFSNSAVLGPTGFLVVAESRAAFASRYGGGIPVAAEYDGALDNAGETLRLFQLNGTNADVLVDELVYSDDPPWPTNADGHGYSLQLMDAVEDNNRVGNWALGTNGTPYTPGVSNSVYRDLPPFPLVWLNEILATNVSGITDNAGDREPWIELFNAEGGAVSLTNYYLTDAYTNLVRWRFPAGSSISATGFALVWADAETNETAGTNWHAAFRLGSPGGQLALVRSNGTQLVIIDYINYPAISQDRSYGDFPDGTWTNRVFFTSPSPNVTNSFEVLLFINEWMADNDGFVTDPADGDYEDWFELYNAGAEAVDLSGYTLTDDLGTPTEWTISNGVVIAAGGFLVVWADEEPEQCTNGVHADFALGKSGDTIALFSPAVTLVDSVTFTAQVTDVSQGRWWDGRTNIYVMGVPTPGTNNIVSTNNAPPVLVFIGNKLVGEGSLLSFTVSATDTDTPAQRLTFSLDPGAPVGAWIDDASGLFLWTPAEVDGPGTNDVTIRVTDNGWTNKNDAETITITVSEVNTAPVVGPVSNLTVGPGCLIVLAIPANDADIPANTLTFSLDPGAPAGAGIGSANGIFSWATSDADALSTNLIVVRATDDGSPVLDGTNVLVVVVRGTDEPFNADGSALGDPNGFAVIWASESGLTYRVQFLGDMLGNTWSNLPGDVLALTPVTSKVDTASGTATQRFYRILQLVP